MVEFRQGILACPHIPTLKFLAAGNSSLSSYPYGEFLPVLKFLACPQIPTFDTTRP